MQADFFAEALRLPEGMVYEPRFLGAGEEGALLAQLRSAAFAEAKYKQFTARRRTVSFGSQYDFGANRMLSAPPIPPWLYPLRIKIGAWVGIEPEQFVHALLTEYRPGAPLGWHRDVPAFDVCW